jgi:hypothetical protein
MRVMVCCANYSCCPASTLKKGPVEWQATRIRIHAAPAQPLPSYCTYEKRNVWRWLFVAAGDRMQVQNTGHGTALIFHLTGTTDRCGIDRNEQIRGQQGDPLVNRPARCLTGSNGIRTRLEWELDLRRAKSWRIA